jgi:hypothetical protein
VGVGISTIDVNVSVPDNVMVGNAGTAVEGVQTGIPCIPRLVGVGSDPFG